MQALDIPFDLSEETSLSLLDEAGRLSRRMQKVPESAPHIIQLQKRFRDEVGPMADWRNKATTADDVYNKVMEIWHEAYARGGISEENYNEFNKKLDAIRDEWAADPNHEYSHGFGPMIQTSSGRHAHQTEYHTEKEHLASFPAFWITSGTVGSSAALSPQALVSPHLKREPYKEEADFVAALATEVPVDIFDTWLMTEQLEGMEGEEEEGEEEEVDRDQAEKDILTAIELIQKRMMSLSKEKDFDNIKKDVVGKLQEFLK